VWFRHAKAGESCEHVDVLHTLEGDVLTRAFRTCRGEGEAFGYRARCTRVSSKNGSADS
jgi:hypothetical protein